MNCSRTKQTRRKEMQMEKRTDMRAEALDTLIDIERNKKLSHIAIGETLMRNQFEKKADRAFYTRLCEGVTERKIYLDYILDHYSKTPMKKCKPLIRSLLRMGAYQILFMDVRDAAACSEAVSLAKKRGFGRLSGFVNGVLRTLVREKENLPVPDKKDDVKYVSITYSVPEWLSKLIIEQYGKESAEKIFASFLEARPLTIRTNLSKTTPEELEKELEEAGVKVEKGNYLPYAFTISNLNYLGKIAAFRQGKFAVQDESSQLAVAIADINEGDFVLDVCAAPGGKTFHAADRLKGAGKVLSRDLTEYKTELIEENKDRMHYENVEVQQWDALEEDESLLESVDVLLADLPCSGLGIMGRKNDIKYQMTEEQLGELAALQRQILSVVWKYVKPGGQMIFSTCTLNKGENAENIKWIEENTPLHLVSIEEYLPQNLKNRTGSQGYLQLIPGEDTCDGFFISKFKQIYGWLHQKLVRSPEEMKNVPAKCIEKLLKEHPFYGVEEVEHYESKIDGTQKFLFSLHDGNMVESVLMKYKHGNSVCISSQAGCRMGCRFCASTLLGLSRNLYPSEMLDQIYAIQKATGERVSHLVVMGTGEPFDNFESLCRMIELLCSPDGLNISHRNITVSTCGIVPKIYEFADRNPQVTLAISLHSPNDTMRRELMPIANKYSMDELMEAARYYTRTTGRRITFEYSLVKGVNDKKEHAQELISRVKGMNCHINLIPVNPIKERDFEQSTQNNVAAFKHILERQHIQVTVRREMGRDIQAACGQLRKSYKERSGDE